MAQCGVRNSTSEAEELSAIPGRVHNVTFISSPLSCYNSITPMCSPQRTHMLCLELGLPLVPPLLALLCLQVPQPLSHLVPLSLRLLLLLRLANQQIAYGIYMPTAGCADAGAKPELNTGLGRAAVEGG